MGVVRRQVGKESIVAYAAALLGAVNTIFIYTYAFSPGELGFIRFIIDVSLLVAPFLILGFNSVTIRFFPFFRTEEGKHNGLLTILLSVLAFGSLLFLILGYFFYDYLNVQYFEQDDPLSQYLYYLFPVAVLMSSLNTVCLYCSNFFRIVVPSILNNLLIKLGLSVLSILFAFQFISFAQILLGLVGLFAVLNFFALFYLYSLGELRLGNPFSLMARSKGKEMGTYAFWAVLGSVGSKLSTRIDAAMIPMLLGWSSNGIYSIALFIGTMIDIPKRSISKMTSPLVAEAWKNEDFGKLNELYQRSSEVQTILACLMGLLVWTNLDHIYNIMPNGDKFVSGKMAVYFLVIKCVIDMTFSISTEIINYSKFYKYNFIGSVLMGVINIGLNFLLIPAYGITGAAMATLISVLIYDLFKYAFLLRKDIQPFSSKSFPLLIWASVLALIIYFIPNLSNPFVDAIWQSGFVAILFLGIIYKSGMSPELTEVGERLLNKWQSK